MTWLLCDYGEVLCLPPSASDQAALAAAAGWDRARGDFWAAYWVDRPAYDRADLTAEEYWARLLDRRAPSGELRRIIAVDAAGWVHPNPISIAAAERAAQRGLQLAILSNAPVEVAKAIDARRGSPLSPNASSAAICVRSNPRRPPTSGAGRARRPA